LTALARQKGHLAARLVREAVRKVYISEGEKMARSQSFNKIISLK